jgi:dCTP deaminase
MSSLVDWQIEQLCKSSELVAPYNELQLNPASYDVLLGNELLIERPPVNGFRSWEKINLLERFYWLAPGELVLGCTHEIVKIPDNIESVFCLKSSRGREGFDHVLSAYIDPGFSGRITLEIHNSNRFNPLKLYAGLRIGQLRFGYLNERPRFAYDVTGRYHLDMGPEPSKG